MSTKSEQNEKIKKALLDCGIDAVVWKRKLTDKEFGEAGKNLRNYLTSPQHENDKEIGKGFWLYNEEHSAAMITSVFAKELRLTHNGVLLSSLYRLVLALRYQDDDFDTFQRYDRVPVLAIWDFQDEGERPLSHEDRLVVQEFLQRRNRRNVRNIYGATASIAKAHWWTRGFRERVLAPYSTEIEVP